MVREALAQIGGKKLHQYTATVGRYGTSYKGINDIQPTLLLLDVKLNNRLIADHLWVRLTSKFRKIGRLYPGDKLQFRGRIKKYLKFNEEHHRVYDYGLKGIKNIHVLSSEYDYQPLPDSEYDDTALVGMILTENESLIGSQPYMKPYKRAYQHWLEEQEELKQKWSDTE